VTRASRPPFHPFTPLEEERPEEFVMSHQPQWEERPTQSPLKVLAPFLIILIALLAWGVFSG
jgi:hypothetical protein